MKRITSIRKAVCIMANQLRREGYSSSQAFIKAWCRVKVTMTIRVVGTTAENRQERLSFLAKFPPRKLTVTLEREPKNQYDDNAIKVIVHIPQIRRKTVIGYVPKGLTKELAKVIDKGIMVKPVFQGVIGGYGAKDKFGALLNIAI